MLAPLVLIALFWRWLLGRLRSRPVERPVYGRRRAKPGQQCRSQKKPAWVRHRIVHMKAMTPNLSGRAIARNFNAELAPDVTVGKTFVCAVIRSHRHEIARLRARIRNRAPSTPPRNRVWGIDLTGRGDSAGTVHRVLGIVDHGTRRSPALKRMPRATSLALALRLLWAVLRFGRPRAVRTDNEAVFLAPPFRWTLRLLDIRHQRSHVGCPWMNGRVERFFGTVKAVLKRWEFDTGEDLDRSLAEIRRWYNGIRRHQNLRGQTPDEAWRGVDPTGGQRRYSRPFLAMDGLLQGYELVRCP